MEWLSSGTLVVLLPEQYVMVFQTREAYVILVGQAFCVCPHVPRKVRN